MAEGVIETILSVSVSSL